MKRRDFFKKAATVAGSAALGGSTLMADETGHPVDNRKVSDIALPQKRPLITYSDRPPLLETPREVFANAITPNDLFFVRWHMPMIPTYINPHYFSISIDGEVKKPTKVSLKSLKTEFEAVEITSVLQCGGNSRSAFHPTPGGIQWGPGAMGCAKWKGARLKDVLAKAGLKPNAAWIKFNGLEKPVYSKTDRFVRALELSKIHDDIIIAYEMNGEELPYLNGFPVRLILPGFYSDSWIKMLSNITVTDTKPPLHFMDHAYRIPDNNCECETPDHLAEKTKPIEEMNVNALIGYPVNGTKVRKDAELIVRGVAFDGGHGIARVEISTDGGTGWQAASLDDGKQGKYAYRTFTYRLTPDRTGSLSIMARATNTKGETQPFAHEVKWNRGGYKYNGIDEVAVEVLS
ncbi:molybdopterin-dependent oxidoreductase [Sulfurovum sp. NBC37-1]|uniref:molybdopterin-dependent oxidoreductase n=1 Tax=Sulfurovum sp. (strain NBC37-1) TaxID=387093 RepID=UPI0001587A3C|nr:molybdopterin-dependent oxidoreductase [Sulfurovum sp. NBC37-1]BAF72427.1 sulfite:cytochrome c oxidoreductase subunit A [Sulfurovum sp. NBC37-1]